MLAGATFTRRSFVRRPTAMSLAMASVGIIPGVHVIQEHAKMIHVRGNSDYDNERPSVRMAI